MQMQQKCKIKTEVILIGSGSTALLASNRLLHLGVPFVLINPAINFSAGDLRLSHGLSLWNKAYRAQHTTSLSEVYESTYMKLHEVFPVAINETALSRCEGWWILSNESHHRNKTLEYEKEFFKLEKKTWSLGKIQLASPEQVINLSKRNGLNLSHISKLDGAIVRKDCISWDALKISLHLIQFAYHRLSNQSFIGCNILGRYGKQIIIKTKEEKEVQIESERGIFIFLTGEILPYLKPLILNCDDPWLQGVKKRRHEQHFLWTELLMPIENSLPSFWIELGNIRYFYKNNSILASWHSHKGPDNFEKVAIEATALANSKMVRTLREFYLEWEWKVPMWKKTNFDTYWATSFEGDLCNSLEILWTLPQI